MLEMIIFAVTFVVAQVLAGFVMMELILSKGYMKRYFKKIMKMSIDIAQELEDEEEL
jgi:uncharacterized membrane protein YciS (DUF1049 family)